VEAARWLQQWRGDTKRKPPDIEDLPVYDEVFQQLVEAMPIEKRLVGLAPARWILALPLPVLRVLPEEYLRVLPAEVQEQVRRRLQGAAHGGPRPLAPPTEVPRIAPVFCLHPTLTAPTFGFG